MTEGRVPKVIDDVVPDIGHTTGSNGVELDSGVPNAGTHATNDVVADVNFRALAPRFDDDAAVSTLSNGGLADLQSFKAYVPFLDVDLTTYGFDVVLAGIPDT